MEAPEQQQILRGRHHRRPRRDHARAEVSFAEKITTCAGAVVKTVNHKWLRRAVVAAAVIGAVVVIRDHTVPTSDAFRTNFCSFAPPADGTFWVRARVVQYKWNTVTEYAVWEIMRVFRRSAGGTVTPNAAQVVVYSDAASLAGATTPSLDVDGSNNIVAQVTGVAGDYTAVAVEMTTVAAII